MCDVESYIYLPLIEEMGYMPQRRYASGHEIRKYCEKVCAKYGLHDRAVFQSRTNSMVWDEDANGWMVEIIKKPKGGQESTHRVRADFVMIAPGVLSNAKLPDVEGIESFEGHMFHTARWDYDYTGGSPEQPDLTGLRGKKVALIGTGATAVQAVPELAKYAEELTVFQQERRIPAWVVQRQELNFATFLTDSDDKPAENLVDDGWTHFPSYSAVVGTPKEVTMENVGERIGTLHAQDYPRQERIRQRTKEIVKDQNTAEALQAWYPGWCKRPCFHDHYLQTFNLPNVKLLNTEGRSIDRVSESGIKFAGKTYDCDVIIWGTGFRSPVVGSSAGKANISVIGRGGTSMEDLATSGDLQTLHGATMRHFPNLFSPGPSQASATANFTFVLDILTSHQAYIIVQALARAGEGKKPVIEPTQEAMDEWSMRILSGAATFAGMAGCTPSYFNKEGETDQITEPAQQMKMARNAIWPKGFPDYCNIIEAWRAEGSMKGLEVSVVG
ncbi:uncharacterized protein LTR77_004288 [Saxophila tyrrhenica]|uniref:Uncharacterized protein n=1 Tax=Saxophila tyrrhenica TaxID=1690608 RepID=A0AAV9PET9_9PEZI|nr:hypothetical protein LTR77_004288 [Saxophila tyrrhenica]